MARRTVIDPRLLPHGEVEAVEVVGRLWQLGHEAMVLREGLSRTCLQRLHEMYAANMHEDAGRGS